MSSHRENAKAFKYLNKNLKKLFLDAKQKQTDVAIKNNH